MTLSPTGLRTPSPFWRRARRVAKLVACISFVCMALWLYGIFAPLWGQTPRERVSMSRREMTRFAETLREEGRQPAAPPDDPFTDPPRKVQMDPSRRIIWSVGLDEVDDGGRLLYDPTNGVISRGDIVVEFPDAGIPARPGQD